MRRGMLAVLAIVVALGLYLFLVSGEPQVAKEPAIPAAPAEAWAGAAPETSVDGKEQGDGSASNDTGALKDEIQSLVDDAVRDEGEAPTAAGVAPAN